jgi:radical SAM protein with 4Fe4S-binding SPASM domain
VFAKKAITPEYVTLFVTQKCNLKCEHCFYWESLNTNINALSLDEIEKISASMNDFLFLLITGGEPFLRKDLTEVVEVFYKNNNVRKMNIMSNGTLPERMLSRLKEIYNKCPDLYLTLYISFDGIGEQHSTIRGVKDCYEKSIDTIRQIKEVQDNYPKLSIGVAMTYCSFNEKNIVDIYKHFKETVQPDTFTCSFIRGDPKDKLAKDCKTDNYVKLQEIFKQDLLNGRINGVSDPVVGNIVAGSKFAMTQQLVKTLTDGYQSPCYAGQINAVIYENGDVFPCELLPDAKIGNLRDSNYDFNKVWFGDKRNEITDWISKTNCHCTHECNLLPNVIYNPKNSLGIIKNALQLSAKKSTRAT